MTLCDESADAAALVAAILDGLDRFPSEAVGIVEALPRGAVADPNHAPIIDAIRGAAASGPVPTIADVAGQLRAAGHGPGSAPYVAMIDAVADVIHTGRRALDTGREAAARLTRHHAAAVARRAAERFVSTPDPVGLAELREAVAAVDAVMAAGRPLPTALDAIDRWARHDTTPAVATGFPWFDNATGGGLPVGGIVALVAPPGGGKSALALQLTVGSLVSDPQCRAVWAAGEMSLEGIGRRLVAVGSGLVAGARAVSMHAAGIRTPHAREAGRLIAAAIGDRLSFVEPPITAAMIDAAVAAAQPRLCIVDYVQILSVPDGGRDRVADLDRTIGQLRDIAIRRECAMIVVSSLAKGTGAAAHAGQLGRGSAEIGFAAELVYAAEREESADGRPVVGPDSMVGITWRCAKARNGEHRDLVTRFDGSSQTFFGVDDPTSHAAWGARLGTYTLDTWTAPESQP